MADITAILCPDEDELCLLMILLDPSGLDLAEFSWEDSESEFGCYRAWDFQHAIYRSMEPFQVEQGARAVGKTVGITMRSCAFPFLFPGQGMLITAPELTHLRPLTDAIESRLMSTRVLREMLPATQGHGMARQPHWQVKFKNGTRIVSRLPQKDGKGVKGCLPAVALVLTRDRGQVSIADVQVGDEVLTHLGRWRKVLANYRYDPPLDAVEVTGGGHRNLVMSEKHSMLMRRNRNPQRTRNLQDPEWVNIANEYPDEIEKRWYLGSPCSFPAEPVPGWASEQMLRLAGAYVADGCISNENRQVHITDDEHEMERLERLFDRAGFTGRSRRRANGTCDVYAYSPALAERMASEFGRLAGGKRIPTWLLGAPDGLKRAFLDGYLAGDGHWDSKRERWTVSSASKGLIIQLRLLVQSLGFGATYTWVDPKVTEICGVELKAAPQRSHQLIFGPRADVVCEDGVMWRKLRTVTPIELDEPVYDLSVEEDFSYIADGLISHNQHVIQIEMDEAQDYPVAGWVEIGPTLNRGLEGASWRVHGVPKGVRDRFWEITEGTRDDGDASWVVHRPMAMQRPTWNDQERKENIRQFGGSRQHVDYKRNIYGEHGDASSVVFVLAKLTACVDLDEGSKYNSEVYTRIPVLVETLPKEIESRRLMLSQRIQLPGEHKHGWSQFRDRKEIGAPQGYESYWGGMDVGVTNHPSEILICGQRRGSDLLDLLTRVHLQRINTDDQMYVVELLFDFYGDALRALAIDVTGVGFPIGDSLSRHPRFGSRIHGYNFSSKVPVGFEDRPLVGAETMKDLVIERNVVEASTDWLRNDYVDVGKIRLPFDREVLLEFQGQTYMVQKDSGSPYGTRRVFGGGSFHSLDAMKMVMAGKFVPPLQAMVEKKEESDAILDVFVGGY